MAVAYLEHVGSAPAKRELHLWIVGDGPERGALEERARAAPALAGRVHFAGHQADLVPWYQAMDLFALSSDSEQHPLALIEAMACGLPVVATDVGDVRLVLPDEQAPYLVTLGTHGITELARALTGLIGDPERRARLGRQNRARVLERYAFGAMLARYAGVYAELLARR
jgi:glycosyltransferase involved in cell wall biosynthesis